MGTESHQVDTGGPTVTIQMGMERLAPRRTGVLGRQSLGELSPELFLAGREMKQKLIPVPMSLDSLGLSCSNLPSSGEAK